MGLSDEHKAKLSLAMKGRKKSDEHCKNLSESLKGKLLTKEHKEKLSLAHKGKTFSEERKEKMRGWNHNDEAKEKIRAANIGRIHAPITEEVRAKCSTGRKGKDAWNKGKSHPKITGDKHPFWIKDRNKLAKRQERNDSAYVEWRKSVWQRDNYKCRINDASCKGRLETHHIFGWSKFPELRYEITNGITLCNHHHPKKRAEENRLINFFKSLINL